MPEICAPCTELPNDNYTLRTGDLYYCGDDGITRSVGNVRLLDFTFTPNSIEHRSGKTGSVDAVIPLSEDFGMVVTIDEITARNLALLLGQDVISSVGSCTIPLHTIQCVREYSVQFVHNFPCSDRSLTIDIWRAIITPVETTVSFGEEIVNFPITVRAKDCSSIHPTAKYGQIVFNETCPAS